MLLICPSLFLKSILFWLWSVIPATLCKHISETLHLTWYIPDHRLPLQLYWILLSSGLLRGIRWFQTDVSGLPVQSSRAKKKTSWPSKVEPTGSPKTLVSDNLMPHNNPEERRRDTCCYCLEYLIHVTENVLPVSYKASTMYHFLQISCSITLISELSNI